MILIKCVIQRMIFDKIGMMNAQHDINLFDDCDHVIHVWNI